MPIPDPHDPLDFTPVPRGPSSSGRGWSVARQRNFIAVLAETGNVRVATEAVGMSYANVHRLRAYPGAESFRRAWDAAIGIATSRVQAELIDHSINGTPEPVWFGGKLVGERRRFNHRTMMWLLQHHRPDLYAGGGGLGKGSVAAPAEMSPAEVDQARDALAKRLSRIRDHRLRTIIAADPAKRAAYEVLNGPQD